MKGRRSTHLARYSTGLFLALFLLTPLREAAGQRLTRTQQIVRPPELNVQFHRAETAWKSGNSLLEAKVRIDRVLLELPDDLEARKLRAGILMTMGHDDRAYADARKAVELGPEDGEAHLLLCESASNIGENIIGETALLRSADLLLDGHDLHIRLSQCAVSLDRLIEAQAYARIALATDALDSEAYLQLARVFASDEYDENAITILERGLSSGVVKPSQIISEPVYERLLIDPRLQVFLGNQ